MVDPRGQHLALWLSGLALAGLCGWLGWKWLAGEDRSHALISWQSLAPAEQVPLRPWAVIVIHHSDTRRDTTASIDTAHRKRGWDGVGYHFVIGNGWNMPEGQIDPTFRWIQQREGAHAGSSLLSKPYNESGIGICLVGRFDEDHPGVYQEARLAELCAVLIRHLPGLTPSDIIGHRDVPGKETACPGKFFDVEHLRFLVRQLLEEPEQL